MDTKLKDLIINEVTEEKLKELEDNNEIPPNELFVTEDEDEALIIDEALNANSENPIANKVVTQKFNEIEPSVLFAESERQKSKNLWYSTTKLTNKSTSGLIVNHDPQNQKIIYNGTTTDYSYFSLTGNIFLKAGTYTIYTKILSGTKTDGGQQAFIHFSERAEFITINVGGSTVFNLDQDQYLTSISFQSWSGITYADYSFVIQLEKGNIATDYQPYNGAILHERDVPFALKAQMICTMSSDQLIELAHDKINFDNFKEIGIKGLINYDSSSRTFSFDSSVKYFRLYGQINLNNLQVAADYNIVDGGRFPAVSYSNNTGSLIVVSTPLISYTGGTASPELYTSEFTGVTVGSWYTKLIVEAY